MSLSLMPLRFVGHSHRQLENRTCHWGFDSSNWRCYLHLAKDKTAPASKVEKEGKEEEEERLTKLLEEVKDRFNVLARTKRKVSVKAQNSFRSLISVIPSFIPFISSFIH